MPSSLLEDEEELFEAVKAGREDKVRALLTRGCRVSVADKEGKTVFHWASQYGHLAILCLLLSSTPCRLPASPSLTAQACVCTCNTCQRENGSTQAVVPPRDDEASLPADEAVKDGSFPSPNREENVNMAEREASVLKRAARNNNCTCTSRAVTSHVVNSRDVNGQVPLHVACNYRREDVASFLVTLPYCDINCADNAGNTPLHRAIHNDLDNVACLLCDAGADVLATNDQLRTPLHEAIRSGSENIVRSLLARGCDLNAVTKGMAATTPFLTGIFYYKISNRSSDYGRSLDVVLRLLIEAGCKLSQSDYQWTPLSASIDIENSFIASLLLFNGCRVQKNYTNRTHSKSLLVEAFARCETYVVKLLVLCGHQPTLDEVEQCYRRIPSFSPLFYRISRSERVAMRSKSELVEWLRQRATWPCSLMELCRTSIRQALNHAAGDASILKRIPELPLPSGLRMYVTLSDFTESGFL